MNWFIDTIPNEVDKAYLLYEQALTTYVDLLGRKMDACAHNFPPREVEHLKTLCDMAWERFERRYQAFVN